MTIAKVKPQKAVPLIQPSCSLERWNSEPHEAAALPRRAKLMAVTIRAMQLARKRRVVEWFMGGGGILSKA